MRELQGRLEETERRAAALEAELRRSRDRDTLTGLVVRNGFFRRLEPETERAKRHGSPLSVAVMDVDGLRAINAHHGRDVGDRVLVEIASVLARETNSTDRVARSGPDEFAVMMPGTDCAAAAQGLERILLELEQVRVGALESVTISVGVAQWERPQSADQLFDRAVGRVEVARSLGGGRIQSTDPDDRTDPIDGRHDVVAALSEALLERDRYTGEHSESVVKLVESVARGLALSVTEVNTVKAAALLHDIGKVAIPDHILNKPGPLDADEWEIMREHPVIGERILRAIPGMGGIARILRHEHERFDGSGYPDGLAGQDIPIGARIILACDAYHAMTSDRPYREAMAHATAVRELAAGAGSQFDPEVTEILIGCLYGRGATRAA
ncbi:MAG: diguanylate cyclase [Thermoleophilaceae bacterium]|nr:diguanylate cyclase [Thermoleophilaceae bacterium]